MMADRADREIHEHSEQARDTWMVVKVIMWWMWFACLSNQLFFGRMPLSISFVLACIGVGLWEWRRLRRQKKRAQDQFIMK